MRTRWVAGVLVLAGGLSACKGGTTPSEVYTSYRAAFDKAKAIDELFPYMDKASRAKVEAAPAEERKSGFEMIKAFSEVADVKVAKETVTGETAVVEATGLDLQMGADARATVQLVKEDGAWKIQKEKWGPDESAPKPAKRACPELVADLKQTALAPRARAAAALREFGSDCGAAVPELLRLLDDPSSGIRGNAVAGLRMNLKRENAKDHAAHLPALVAAKQKADAAGETMAQIHLQNAVAAFGPVALPHLLADLKSPSRELRWGAAAGIGMMGPEAKEALPALEAAAKEEKDATVLERLNAAVSEVKGS